MRRSRSLSRHEQWDIFLLMCLFMVTLLCVAAIWKSGKFPRLFAFASNAPMNVTPVNGAKDVILGPQQAAAPKSIDFPPMPILAPAPQAPAPMASISASVSPAPIMPVRPITSAADIKTFKGDKYRFLKTVKMRVTAYAPDPRCCWPYPGTTTASGLSVKTNGGKLVAADTKVLPFNSLVSVPGYHAGEAVPVLDRGDAIKGMRLDVLLPTYAQAQNWGSRVVDVKVYVPVQN